MIYEQSCLVLKTIAGAVKVTRKTPTTEVSAANFKCYRKVETLKYTNIFKHVKKLNWSDFSHFFSDCS